MKIRFGCGAEMDFGDVVAIREVLSEQPELRSMWNTHRDCHGPHPKTITQAELSEEMANVYAQSEREEIEAEEWVFTVTVRNAEAGKKIPFLEAQEIASVLLDDCAHINSHEAVAEPEWCDTRSSVVYHATGGDGEKWGLKNYDFRF